MLAYDVQDDGSVLFIVSRDRFAMVDLPVKQTIDAAVAAVSAHINKLRTLIDQRVPDVTLSEAAASDIPLFAADSYRLYQLLIPPVAAPYIDRHDLIVTSSGTLSQIPWSALVTDVSAPHYLIEDHAISYTPSGSLLALLRNGESVQPAPDDFIAFARPDFGGGAVVALQRGGSAALQYADLRAGPGDFSDLPGTEAETDAVLEQLRNVPGTTAAYMHDAASRAKLLELNDSDQLAKYRYLLFATHAVLTRVSGITSPTLVLAYNPANSFVTVNDILGLTLRANFVDLSACDTAAGSRDIGDGVNAMVRAFLYAGTPAVSVTLWSVSDKAAPEMTPTLFSALAVQHETPAQGLQQAQRRMIDSNGDPLFRHPFAWAPYVVYGDGAAAQP
jgi:CHAT domain-containing protein